MVNSHVFHSCVTIVCGSNYYIYIYTPATVSLNLGSFYKIECQVVSWCIETSKLSRKSTLKGSQFTYKIPCSCMQCIPAQCISHLVSCLAAVSGVHPHEAWSTLTPSTNLDEEQLPQFACPPNLVMIPGDDRVGAVRGTVDIQLPLSGAHHFALQCQYVRTNDAAPWTHLLGQDVHRPHGIWIKKGRTEVDCSWSVQNWLEGVVVVTSLKPQASEWVKISMTDTIVIIQWSRTDL